MTIQDIQGLIALAITNNRAGFINALAANGYAVPARISDEELYSFGLNILSEKGTEGIVPVLNRVPLNKAALSTEMKDAITQKFSPVSLRGFGDWFNDTITFVGDIIGGSSISGSPTTNVQSTSALSPGVLAIIVMVGIILMVIFRKFIGLVIGIIVVVLAVVLYGIFAKNISSTTTSATTQQHGGIGAALLALIGLK